jgi:Cupredoxin-like domain
MPRRLHRQDIELGRPHHQAIACAIKDAACAMKDIAFRRLHLKSIAFATAVIASISLSAPTFASDGDASEIHFRNGRFEPAQLVVPANTPFKVQVTNLDTAAIEFESFELHRERVVRPGQTITVLMAPVAPGSYKFFDDFDHGVAEGAILAK